MNDIFLYGLYVVGAAQGVLFGYLTWAPETNFKRGFVNGITFGIVKKT
jgi:hypothetical protein